MRSGRRPSPRPSPARGRGGRCISDPLRGSIPTSSPLRTPPLMTLTRRRLLNLVGKAGGAAASYRTMAAMGLLPVPAAYAGPPDLPPGSGHGVSVVIVGAGIAGMVAAL